jgi:uncharacterized protein YjiS (DUF1127 family)
MLLKDSEWLPRLVAAEYRSFAEEPSLVARLADHATALFADLMEALAEWRRRRETYRKLAELDDHMLQDLGIARSDLPGWTSRGIGGWSSFDPRRRGTDRRQ